VADNAASMCSVIHYIAEQAEYTINFVSPWVLKTTRKQTGQPRMKGN